MAASMLVWNGEIPVPQTLILLKGMVLALAMVKLILWSIGDLK